MKVAIPTLGCKANQADGIALADGLAARLPGMELVNPRDVSDADVVVVNTCTVTHTADADARQIVRRFRRSNPDAKIVVTGCYAQTDREALEAMPEIDHVVGNAAKASIPGLIERLVTGTEAPGWKREGNREWNPTLRDAANIRKLRQGRSRPFLKVQDGCNYVCSFCIIPRARGTSRSIGIDQVVAEVARYQVLGAREIVLSGIHLGHWGRDLTPRRTFGAMLTELLERTDVQRFRISSLEPNEVDAEVIDLVSNHPRVCPHLHIPLQSGDDLTLARMRRVYRTEKYRQIHDAFRGALPRGAWGMDVMVGFPGETEERFQASKAFMESLDFTYLHVFPYSPRRDTPAAEMPGQVDPRVKRQRVTELTTLSEIRRARHAEQSVGETGQVLVEERRVKGQLRGFTEHYVPVLFDGPAAWVGEVVPVEILDAAGQSGLGRAL